MEMILDHEYHVVELHKVSPPQEMFEWLGDRLGRHDRWFYRNRKIYFKRADDHLMFLLRWASE